MIPILRAIALRKKQNKDTGLKMAWLWPFWLVFGLSDTLYNLTICEKDVICVQSSNCQHDLQESLQKLSDFIAWGEVTISRMFIS